MDLKLLSSFIAVAEEGQLGRAAARLHLSQPPLSRHIQALETELGTTLFTRTSTGMELTQAGKVLLEEARHIGLLVKNATEKVKSAGEGRFGQLNIGVYGSAIYGVTSNIINAFRKNNPDVVLNVFYAQTPHQVQALRHGQVEIVFERMIPNEDDIIVHRICEEPLYVAMHKNHVLAQQAAISPASLHNELFLIGNEVTASSKVIEICKTHGFFPRLAPSSSSVVTATLLAATGMGVSLVPQSMTNVHFPDVVYRPLQDSTASMDLHCFYLKKAPSPMLRLMLENVAHLFNLSEQQGAST